MGVGAGAATPRCRLLSWGRGGFVLTPRDWPLAFHQCCYPYVHSHPFNKCLLKTCLVPGTVLGAGSTNTKDHSFPTSRSQATEEEDSHASIFGIIWSVVCWTKNWLVGSMKD